jgi:opacity protein-like surface antigen
MNDDPKHDYSILLSSNPAFLTRTIFTNTLRSLVLALSMLALSHAALAQAVEVAPFTGHRFGGSFVDSVSAASLEVADTAAFGLVLDFDLEPDKQIEVLLSRQNSHLSSNDPLFTPNPLFDLTIDYYHIGGLFMLPVGDRVRPFLTGTFGLTRMDPKPADLTTENRFSLSLGGGAKIFFTKNLGLRFDLRGIYTSLNANTEVFCSGGCTIKVNSSGFVQTEASAALMMRF